MLKVLLISHQLKVCTDKKYKHKAVNSILNAAAKFHISSTHTNRVQWVRSTDTVGNY